MTQFAFFTLGALALGVAGVRRLPDIPAQFGAGGDFPTDAPAGKSLLEATAHSSFTPARALRTAHSIGAVIHSGGLVPGTPMKHVAPTEVEAARVSHRIVWGMPGRLSDGLQLSSTWTFNDERSVGSNSDGEEDPDDDEDDDDDEDVALRQRPDAALGVMKVTDAKTGETYDVAMPANWVERFEPGSLHILDETNGFRASGTWTTPDGERKPVILRAQDSTSPSMQRELFMLQRLKDFRALGYTNSHCVLPYYDSVDTKQVTFAVTAPDTHTLAEIPRWSPAKFAEKQLWGQDYDTSMAVPLTQGLSHLVDILYGLHELEEAGILHGAVVPENIAIVEGRARISGLSSLCLEHGGETLFGCTSLRDNDDKRMVGSPLWQAPEVTDGAPTSPKNHVWGAGLLFATMCMGYNPAASVPGLADILAEGDRDTKLGRELVRRALRNGFNIERERGSKLLDEDLQHLLMGMLAENPDGRWSTAEALAEALQVANARRIPTSVPAVAWMVDAPGPAWSVGPDEGDWE